MVDREGGGGRGEGTPSPVYGASTCRAVWNWEMALSRLLVANAYRPCSGQTGLHGEPSLAHHHAHAPPTSIVCSTALCE